MTHRIKTIPSFLAAVVVAVSVQTASPLVFAQQQPVPLDPNKPDEQLTKDEADVRIKQFREAVIGLEAQLKQGED